MAEVTIVVDADKFAALVAALDRAQRKGYLPDAMAQEWDAFNWEEAGKQAPSGQQAEPCPTCGGSKIDPGGLPVCRSCGQQDEPTDACIHADLCNIEGTCTNGCEARAKAAGQKPVAPAGREKRIDAAADALSEVLAYVKLDRLEPKVSRALSGLRALQALAGQQSERPQSDLIRPPRQGQPSGATSGVTPERGGADHPSERPAPAGQAVVIRALTMARHALVNLRINKSAESLALANALDEALAGQQSERPAPAGQAVGALKALVSAINWRAAVLTSGNDDKIEFADAQLWKAVDEAQKVLASQAGRPAVKEAK